MVVVTVLRVVAVKAKGMLTMVVVTVLQVVAVKAKGMLTVVVVMVMQVVTCLILFLQLVTGATMV